MNENDDFNKRVDETLREPVNLGEMNDADAAGTAGSADCGDMLKMWVKFRDKDGKRVIDRASFQTFGCQTAIAVASMATEMIRGKTSEEALAMDRDELSKPLGPLPPMKIHCAQLVEEALQSALAGGEVPKPAKTQATPLAAAFEQPESGKIKIKSK